jgi:enoyl-CoA hydratase/carnithine racemase
MNNKNKETLLMSDIVLQQLDQGLLTITMNRPDRRNALNADMTQGLVEAARRAAEDSAVRAVLIKGAGGTFCVGGDVRSRSSRSSTERRPAPACRSRFPAICALRRNR